MCDLCRGSVNRKKENKKMSILCSNIASFANGILTSVQLNEAFSPVVYLRFESQGAPGTNILGWKRTPFAVPVFLFPVSSQALRFLFVMFVAHCLHGRIGASPKLCPWLVGLKLLY